MDPFALFALELVTLVRVELPPGWPPFFARVSRVVAWSVVSVIGHSRRVGRRPRAQHEPSDWSAPPTAAPPIRWDRLVLSLDVGWRRGCVAGPF